MYHYILLLKHENIFTVDETQILDSITKLYQYYSKSQVSVLEISIEILYYFIYKILFRKHIW